MNPSRLPRTPRIPANLLLTGLLLGAALQVGCSSTGAGEERRAEVREAIRAGKFEQGIILAENLRKEAGEDEDVAELHRIATVGFYLDQGRTLTFAGQDAEALAWFKQAEQIDSESPRVQEWVGKTELKLARTWMALGQEAFAREEYAEAAVAYRQALDYVPGYSLALAGLGQVTSQLNYRNGLGEEYYDEGVRSLAEYRLSSAKRGFTATTKYLPRLERAKQRAAEVDQLLADQRVEIALGFEQEGLFAGALNEFRFAAALDGQNQRALDGIERLAVEAVAAQLLRDAQMEVYRKNFDKALVLIEQGEAKTHAQLDAFAAARSLITESRLELIYQRALNSEYDGDFETAVAVYDELLAQVDHYKDALARKSTLEGYQEMAAAYYQRANEEADPALKLEHLRSIAGFWPDYRDVRKLISRLE